MTLHSVGVGWMSEYGVLMEWYWREETDGSGSKTGPSATSSTINLKRTGPGLDRRLRGERKDGDNLSEPRRGVSNSLAVFCFLITLSIKFRTKAMGM